MEILSAPAGTARYEEALALRELVLRKPLGRTFSAEDRAADFSREHLVASLDGRIVGSVSLYMEEPGIVRVKQMAVDPTVQGQRIGARLMAAAETRSRVLGARSVRLYARINAQGFYSKLGYDTISDEFLEIGIVHVIMTKTLA